jgi:hypothetical protein
LDSLSKNSDQTAIGQITEIGQMSVSGLVKEDIKKILVAKKKAVDYSNDGTLSNVI